MAQRKRTYFVAVKTSRHEYDELEYGKDIYDRPMPWHEWIKTIWPGKKNPWRYARMVDMPMLAGCLSFRIEGRYLFIDDEPKAILERVTVLHVIEWAIESVYYRTSLKFWKWPFFREVLLYNDTEDDE